MGIFKIKLYTVFVSVKLITVIHNQCHFLQSENQDSSPASTAGKTERKSVTKGKTT